VNGIEQCCVGREDDAFVMHYRPAPAALRQVVEALGINSSGPYVSEINLHLPEWLRAVTERLETGLALFIDYGYPRAEYYRPERSDGALMCHFRHRAHDDAFLWPGLQDITAFVEFTALAEAGERCGLELSGYTSQTMFLLGCGLERILAQRTTEQGGDAVRLNAEARQLTLPGEMGERFQVMALARGLAQADRDLELCGFSLRDLRHRL
jgi:SAM-dependent MidA family methyltransferase